MDPITTEEINTLLRFWRRRMFYSFTPCEAPNGETDYTINTEHLVYALARIRFLEAMLGPVATVAMKAKESKPIEIGGTTK